VTPPSAAALLHAPAAVRSVDVARPLEDIVLPPARNGGRYRSLLLLARLDGDPIGLVATAVGPIDAVAADELAAILVHQLGFELRAALARRGLSLADWAPSNGVDGLAARAERRSTRPALSVVIPTCAAPCRLTRCIDTVLATGYAPLEVIVADNRPASAVTRQTVGDRYSGDERVRYVAEARVGTSHARNAGLGAAGGELVAFLDDDVVADRRWADRGVAMLESRPDVDCVAGMILPLELETESQLLLEQFADFGKGFVPEVYRLPESRERYPLLPYTPGMIGSGANVVGRGDVFRALRGFDTKLGAGTAARGAEDLDVFVRLLRAGHAIAYEPGAIVWHQHPATEAQLHQRAYEYGVGMGALLAKQLLAERGRLDLVRAVPKGVRYVLDARSRKNAAKPADFPRRLTRLERRGLAAGPGRYGVMAARAAIRRGAPARRS